MPSVPAHAAKEARAVVAHVRQLELADRDDALLGHAVGGLVGRDAVALGDLNDAADVVVDRAHHAHGALAVVAVDLERDVHHAAGIDRVIRRVEDAAFFHLVADGVGGELIVRRAADDLALQARQRGFVDRAAERTGAVDVGVDVVDLVGADRRAAVFVDGAPHQVGVDVGDEHLGAVFAQQLDEFHADVAGALHRVAVLADVLAAEPRVERRHQALHRAVGGERRGIARTAVHLVHAGDEFGLAEHPLHVVDVDADVFGGDVAAVERIDETTERAEQRLGFVLGRIADDHRLAAAQVQAGDGVLVGHAAGQAQHVVDRLGFALVRPHAQTAQRRAEHGVVNGDDGLQARLLVVAEDDFLVARGGDGFEDHRGGSGLRDWIGETARIARGTRTRTYFNIIAPSIEFPGKKSAAIDAAGVFSGASGAPPRARRQCASRAPSALAAALQSAY